jgi:hypothetical protein
VTFRVTPRRILGWTATIGLVAAAATTLAAVVLTITYQVTFDGRTTATEGWLVLHATASSILGMAAFAAFLVIVWPTGGPSPWRRPLPVVATAAATLLAAVAIVTRDLVTFTQVAFASVRVGAGEAGYWFAAFDPDVRFVLVDGSEVGRSAYVVRLVVHLLTPPATAALLALGVRAARGQSGGSST